MMNTKLIRPVVGLLSLIALSILTLTGHLVYAHAVSAQQSLLLANSLPPIPNPSPTRREGSNARFKPLPLYGVALISSQSSQISIGTTEALTTLDPADAGDVFSWELLSHLST